MRFLTYNLWHGLTPSSPLAFDFLEPAGRRRLREQAQIELVREFKPDFCFFQECNPLAKRAPEISSSVRMDLCDQPDLVGLKLFGVGVPLNLNSGLAILGAPGLGLKKIEGVSLSRPGVNLVHTWGSWQLQEERFALFCEALLPKWGRVLLINTHLHHGLESTPEFERKLEEKAAELQLQPQVKSEILSRLRKGSERRAHELSTLLSVLDQHLRRYSAVILAGDFNASPESGFGADLKALGFRDVWLEAHPEGGGLSYDGAENQANHFLQKQFPLTLVVEDLSFSAKVKESLLELARGQEARPRRIDYIWLKAPANEIAVKRVQLVGHPDAEGFAPSDHFGVLADLEVVDS